MTASSLSVIIPFYDEFAFLDRTIGTVLACGKTVSEIILVDDGPEGVNGRLLGPFKKIPRLRYLRNPVNLGAAGTRNRGIEAARGEYILFLDADDTISPRGIAEAMAFARETGAQMVHLPTMVHDPSNNARWRHFRDNALFGTRIARTNVSQAPELRYAVANWSFIYRRDLLLEANIRFDPQQRVAEDHLFLIQCLQAADQVATLDRWCHVWRQRGGSLTSARPSMAHQRAKLLSLEKALRVLRASYADDDPGLQRDYAFGLLRFLREWDFLPVLIEARDIAPEAEQMLESFAASLDTFHFDTDILDDKILRLASWPTPTGTASNPLDRAGFLAMMDAIAERDWPRVAQNHSQTTPTLSPPDINPLDGMDKLTACAPFAWDTDSGVVGAERIVQHNRATARAIVSGCGAAGLRVLLSNPGVALLDRYRRRSDAPRSRERRNFSEYLLDEIDGLMAFPALLALEARAAGVSIQFSAIAREKMTAGDNWRPITAPAPKMEVTDPSMMALADAMDALRRDLDMEDPVRARAVALDLTWAHAVERWRRDLGAAFDVPLSSADAWIDLSGKGALGAAWRLAEVADPVEASLAAAGEADRMRFGDPLAGEQRNLPTQLLYDAKRSLRKFLQKCRGTSQFRVG